MATDVAGAVSDARCDVNTDVVTGPLATTMNDDKRESKVIFKETEESTVNTLRTCQQQQEQPESTTSPPPPPPPPTPPKPRLLVVSATTTPTALQSQIVERFGSPSSSSKVIINMSRSDDVLNRTTVNQETPPGIK